MTQDRCPDSWTRRGALRAVAAAAAAQSTQAWSAVGGMSRPRPAGPPVARIEPVREIFFGQTVVDNYRWMENAKDADWEPFMRGSPRLAIMVTGVVD